MECVKDMWVQATERIADLERNMVGDCKMLAIENETLCADGSMPLAQALQHNYVLASAHHCCI